MVAGSVLSAVSSTAKSSIRTLKSNSSLTAATDMVRTVAPRRAVVVKQSFRRFLKASQTGGRILPACRTAPTHADERRAGSGPR